MNQTTVYLKCDRNVEVRQEDVFMKDLGSIQCADKVLCAKIKSLKVHHFTQGKATRTVISCLKLVQMIEEQDPGVSVEIVGESDVLVEWVDVKKRKGPAVWGKLIIVSMVSFFGTAFTVMGFHNDVDINKIFETVYLVVMNEPPQGINIMEITYSIGLALGIIVCFNHVGPRKLTKDPTPIAVSMHQYEVDVDETLIELANREGKEEDV